MTKVPISSENESQETTQRRIQTFYYTMIAVRLRTVSRSILLYFNYLVSDTAGPRIPEGTCSQVLWPTSVDS